jgi:tetratricopeptide (TPR) repeat protein
MKYLLILILFISSIANAALADISSVIADIANNASIRNIDTPTFENEEERVAKFKRSMTLGSAYLERNYPDEALRKYIYALQIIPEHPDALFMIGTLLIEMKDYKSSVAIFLYLENQFPDDFRLNNNLAWIYCTSEDPTYRDGRKAEEYASRALLYAPQDHHVWSTLAEARYVYGNYEKAVKSAEQALLIASVAKVSESELDAYKQLLTKCRKAYNAEKELTENIELKIELEK